MFLLIFKTVKGSFCRIIGKMNAEAAIVPFIPENHSGNAKLRFFNIKDLPFAEIIE